MSDGRGGDADGAEPSSSARSRRSRNGRPPVLDSVAARLRADPGLWVPFFLAGWLLLGADLLRERDPLPLVSGIDGATIHVPFVIYPTGTTVTRRSLGALVDLQLPWLGYALALEVVAVAAVGLAGWLTMARAGDEPIGRNRGLVYVGGVVLVGLCSRAGDAGGFEYAAESLPVGLVVLALALFVAVRLLLVPITVLRERGLLAPIGASWRYARGRGFALLGILLLVGIGSWLLARVPLVGTVLSATLAGTVHAVSLVDLYERCVGS